MNGSEGAFNEVCNTELLLVMLVIISDVPVFSRGRHFHTILIVRNVQIEVCGTVVAHWTTGQQVE